MSKKKKNELEIISTPEVMLDAKIDKDDLVAISVAHYEAELIERENDARDRITELNKEISELQGLKEEVIQKAGNALTGKKMDAVVKAMKAIGFTTEQVNKIVSFSTRIDRDNNAVVSSITFRVGHYDHESVELRGKVPKTYEKFVKAIEETQEKKDEWTQYALEVKKSLSRLATQERQARASLAMAVASRTKEGVALLEAITNKQSNLLPAPPK